MSSKINRDDYLESDQLFEFFVNRMKTYARI